MSVAAERECYLSICSSRFDSVCCGSLYRDYISDNEALFGLGIGVGLDLPYTFKDKITTDGKLSGSILCHCDSGFDSRVYCGNLHCGSTFCFQIVRFCLEDKVFPICLSFEPEGICDIGTDGPVGLDRDSYGLLYFRQQSVSKWYIHIGECTINSTFIHFTS